MKALELSGGLTETAAKGPARVIRRDKNGSPSEIPVDLNMVLRGETGKVELTSGDILIVPDTRRKRKYTPPYYDPPVPKLNHDLLLESSIESSSTFMTTPPSSQLSAFAFTLYLLASCLSPSA
jgi:hypothetical protein